MSTIVITFMLKSVIIFLNHYKEESLNLDSLLSFDSKLNTNKNKMTAYYFHCTFVCTCELKGLLFAGSGPSA